MSESVQVAVRVRPFNKREKNKKAKVCIEMVNNTTTITNPKTKKPHKFTYDYSYWSHDKSQEFASQESIYKDLGGTIISNTFKGYNSCIFAYGQTGSGKSYSTYGAKESPGIIPRLCDEFFSKIEEQKEKQMNGPNPEDKTVYRVEIAMVEIYAEKVRDLFNPTNPKNKTGLKVRENVKTGPYIEGLTYNVATNYQEMNTMLEEGTKLRTIGATSMNDTSSRAHTIFQIVFTQIFSFGTKKNGSKRISKKKKKNLRVAKINLIDLAGSERQANAKTSGERLVEGTYINLSLSMLGNCINALAELAKQRDLPSKKRKKVFIPYRNSKLTWLLKESLGGNSKTIMIAAISPASCNFAETLSTLQYANRAKAIKNHAVVNEDAQTKLIGDLRGEVARLKSMLENGTLPGMGDGSGGPGGVFSKQTRKASVDDTEKRDLLMKLRESQKLIDKLKMTDEERALQTKLVSEERKRALKEAGVSDAYSRREVPHIVNLNEDPSMNESLIYFFKPDGLTTIGHGKDEGNEIVLQGKGIEEQHCFVENSQNKMVYITPLRKKGEQGSFASVYVNGKKIDSKLELHTHDRIVVGLNHIFRFQNPSEIGLSAKKKEVIDWEFVEQEMKTTMENELKVEKEEKKRKMEQEFQQIRIQEEKKIEELALKRKELQKTVEIIQQENSQREEKENKRRAEINKLEEEINSFNKKLEEEKVQKQQLEEETQKNEKNLVSLKSNVKQLNTQLSKQKKMNKMLTKAHQTEKKQLQKKSKKLKEDMGSHLIPMLQQMICDQDQTHKETVDAYESKIKEQKMEMENQEAGFLKRIEKLEVEKKELKSQADELSKKMKQMEIGKAWLIKTKTSKFRKEKTKLQKMNLRFSKLAKERLVQIQDLEKKVQDYELKSVTGVLDTKVPIK